MIPADDCGGPDQVPDRRIKKVPAASQQLAYRQDSALRRRREASWRMPPMIDGRRDPLDTNAASQGPSTFDLSGPEVLHEARRLWRNGWSEAEVRLRLDLTWLDLVPADAA